MLYESSCNECSRPFPYSPPFEKISSGRKFLPNQTHGNIHASPEYVNFTQGLLKTHMQRNETSFQAFPDAFSFQVSDELNRYIGRRNSNMVITDYRVQSVLRTYTRQLQRSKLLATGGRDTGGADTGAEKVSISGEGKRRLMMDRMTSQVFGKIGPKQDDSVSPAITAS